MEAAKSLAPLSPELSRRALLASFSALMSVYQCAEGTTGDEIGRGGTDRTRGRRQGVDRRFAAAGSGIERSSATTAEAASALRRALATFEEMSAEEITEWYYVGPFIANELWDPDAYRFVVELLETAARQQGSILALQRALLASAAEEVREGRFSAARTRFAELVEITEAVGGFSSFFALLDVELLAWEGEEEAARTKIHDLIESATAFGSGAGILNGYYAMAILELGLGRYPEALTSAQALEAGRLPFWSPFALPLIVEAAMRCADVKTATEALEQIEERAQVVQTPFALGLMWRCRALVWDDDRDRVLVQPGHRVLREVAVAHRAGPHTPSVRRMAPTQEAAELTHERRTAKGARHVRIVGREERSQSERQVELAATGERARTRRVESASDLTVQRTPDRPARRGRAHQPRDRLSTLHQPAHRGIPPEEGLPEARGQVPHPARQGHSRQRRDGRVGTQ